MSDILTQRENSDILIHLSTKIPTDLLLETLKFIPIVQLQKIKLLNKRLHGVINTSNALFKLHFSKNIQNMKPWTRETLYNCTTFAQSALYKTMCRLVSFAPSIAFETSFTPTIPLITLNNLPIKTDSLTNSEKKLFKIQTGYIYDQKTCRNRPEFQIKWNTRIEHFEENLEKFFHYSKWKFILDEFPLYLAGGSVLACLRNTLNHSFAMARDLDFFVSNYYVKTKFHMNMIMEEIIDKLLEEKNQVIRVFADRSIRLKKEIDAYSAFHVVSIFVNFRQSTVKIPSSSNIFRNPAENLYICKNSNEFDQWIKHDKNIIVWRKMQFILRTGIDNRSNLLPTFDIDLCQVGFNGQKVQATPAAFRSMQTNTIISYTIKNNPINSKNTMKRNVKYIKNYKMQFLTPIAFEVHKMIDCCHTDKYQKEYDEWFFDQNNICICKFLNFMTRYTDRILTADELDTFIKIAKTKVNFDWFQIRKQFMNNLNLDSNILEEHDQII